MENLKNETEKLLEQIFSKRYKYGKFYNYSSTISGNRMAQSIHTKTGKAGEVENNKR